MKQKTRIIIYIAIAVTVLVSGILAVLSSSQGAEEKAQKFIDLGNKYLIELSYDKAVIEFNKAIEIEPKNADAYIGLAEAYIGLGDTDSAIDALERGFEQTGDERIKAMLDELLPSEETEVTSAETTTVTTAVTTVETTVTANSIALETEKVLHFSIIDDKNASITLKGVEIKDSYVTNLETTVKDATEYTWDVIMLGNKDILSVSTSCWAMDPGANETKTIEEMQSSLWRKESVGDNYRFALINFVVMTHNSDSITWTVSVPDEYDFSFYNVTECEITVENAPMESYVNFTYTLTSEDISIAE